MQAVAARMLSRLGGNPAVLALATIAACVALVLVPLIAGGFDPSAFILAGDQFVDANHVPGRIIVRQDSDG
jgi:hypothetical protein